MTLDRLLPRRKPALVATLLSLMETVSLAQQAQPVNQPPGLPNTAVTTQPTPPTSGGGSSGTDIWDIAYLTNDWGRLRTRLADDGFTFLPNYIGEVFGNPSGGKAHGVIYEGLLDLPVDFDLEKMSDGGVPGLTIHADALEIHGPGLSSHFIGDFSDTSNIAAYNSIRLQELWIQQKLWNNRVSIKVGNIPVDLEFFQSASSALFINSTFGAFTLLGNNIPSSPTYPLAAPGVRIQVLPIPQFYYMGGVFGSDVGLNQATNDQNGTRFALNAGSGMFIINEVGYLLNQETDNKGLQGTFRVGSWVQTDDYTNWATKAANTVDHQPLHGSGTNFGIYGVMDQQLFVRDDQQITFFMRGGGAPSNLNFVNWYVDSGFNFTGFVQGRKNDVAGLAVARSHVSGDFSDAQIFEGERPYTAETVIEATYKFQMAPWWTVQPDAQYIITPSGEQGSHNATVLGLRTTVAF